MHWSAGSEYYFCAVMYAERGKGVLTLSLFYISFSFFVSFFTGMWLMHTTFSYIPTPLDVRIADSFVRYRNKSVKVS